MANPLKHLLSSFRSGVGRAAAWVAKKSLGERRIAELVGGWSFGASGPNSFQSRQEQVLHYKHFVWRAISTIMELATKELPSVVKITGKNDRKSYEQKVKAWEKNPSTGSQPTPRAFLTALQRKKALHQGKPHQEFEYASPDHPLQRLIENPNGPDTGRDLFQELQLFQELCGIGYLWPFEGSGYGERELWCMPSHWVWPMPDPERKRLVGWYEVRPTTSGYTGPSEVKFGPDELIEFKFKNPISKVDGWGPLQAGAEIIDTFESVQLCRLLALKQGANVGATIKLSADYDGDEAKLRRWKSQWFAEHQGERNFNAPLILPPGAEFIPNPSDHELAMMQSSDQMRDYVLGMWGLTKSVVGFMEDANRASFIAAMAQCYYLCVNPRVVRRDDVLSEKLAPRFGDNLRVVSQDQTPNDADSERADWQMLGAMGWCTPNEPRRAYGLEPYEEGDNPLVPMGISVLPIATLQSEFYTPPEEQSDSDSGGSTRTTFQRSISEVESIMQRARDAIANSGGAGE